MTAAKAVMSQLLLAFRHGNQQAFDAELERVGATGELADLVSALCWSANEAVRKAYRPEAGDQVLRHLARRAPYGERWVLTDEAAAPAAGLLVEAVAAGDTETVRDLVRSTPDTTYLLGKLVLALGLLVPDVPPERVRAVVDELRGDSGDI
ncbi:hypothetical protein ACFQVC_27915 [Streptomyces monticola]|uniref:Uncharacterized protein n=1 Tax=Streptomyces monticola TaxID=2666263 RepID=A0ABW2JQ81_9ACTN